MEASIQNLSPKTAVASDYFVRADGRVSSTNRDEPRNERWQRWSCPWTPRSSQVPPRENSPKTFAGFLDTCKTGASNLRERVPQLCHTCAPNSSTPAGICSSALAPFWSLVICAPSGSSKSYGLYQLGRKKTRSPAQGQPEIERPPKTCRVRVGTEIVRAKS